MADLRTDPLAEAVRRNDPDRYFAALFAPAEDRPLLIALYALNQELASIAEHVREPMLGEIRLQWWRETLEGARAGKPRNHDIAHALSEGLLRRNLSPDLLDSMIGARELDLQTIPFAEDAALETYLDATSGNLIRLALEVLGAASVDEHAARAAGLAYGLTGLARAVPYHARRGRVLLPGNYLEAEKLTAEEILAGKGGKRLSNVVERMAKEARDHLVLLRKVRIPRNALAAFLPVALVPLYLRRLARAGFDPFRLTEISIHRRQMALLHASLRRRV